MQSAVKAGRQFPAQPIPLQSDHRKQQQFQFGFIQFVAFGQQQANVIGFCPDILKTSQPDNPKMPTALFPRLQLLFQDRHLTIAFPFQK